MTKVTVLMAVYNSEAFLKESIDSLLGQTMKEIQVVCVDDASTDGSLAILNGYAQRDSRVEVIHLVENKGQAHARNVGLRHARGEYVCMLDADDSFSPDALSEAVKVMEQENTIDCVLFDVSMDWPQRSELYSMPVFHLPEANNLSQETSVENPTISGEEAFQLSLTWKIHGLYLVKNNIHQKYPYDETCRLYSDDNTTRMHYLASRRVGHCKGIYHYRQHGESMTHKVSVRKFDYLRANESMKQTMTDVDVSLEMMKLYENHRWLNLIGVYMFYYVHGKELEKDERQYGLKELFRTWQNIDRSLLSRETINKFGYRPMRYWWAFRVQEWLYFTLRGLLGKNY